jgi:hypothetical protein
MYRHARLECLVLLVSLAVPTPGSAQAERGGEVTVYAGSFSAAGGVHIVDPRGSYEITTGIEQDGTSFGVLGGYNFNRLTGIEVAFAMTTNQQGATLVDDRASFGPSTNETNLLTFLHAGGVFHLPVPGPVVPYGSLGVGLLGTVGPTTNLAVNYGGGIKVFFSRRVGVRLDLRRYRSNFEDVLTQSVFTGRDSDRCAELDLRRFVCVDTPFAERLRFTELSAGLAVRFPRR